MVIFGASGDLTAGKLIPALFRLEEKGRLPDAFRILGTARRPWSDVEFRRHLQAAASGLPELDAAGAAWTDFQEKIHYLPGDIEDEDHFRALGDRLQALEEGPADRLYYLATSPRHFAPVVRSLGAAGMTAESKGARRVVVEKPFGQDGETARQLNRQLQAVLAERQIYRIDHYLGKETVQNLMVVRFANTIFEPLWNRNYVDNVQITVSESTGVGTRAGYYDQAGVLRDMVQNHMLQLLTLVALEPPVRFTPDALRNEKVKVLEALRPLHDSEVGRHTVRGQYRGYREEPDVAPDSTTATFTALRLHVDNWRWQGVPFYLRTGKRLATKSSRIHVQFRCPPQGLFESGGQCHLTSNRLSIQIQPDEGMHLRFETKVPGQGFAMQSKQMEFTYREAFEDIALPDAYERLLLDALKGDASLFTRADEIALSWQWIDEVLAVWAEPDAPPLEVYEPGSRGPEGAETLIHRAGRQWNE